MTISNVSRNSISNSFSGYLCADLLSTLIDFAGLISFRQTSLRIERPPDTLQIQKLNKHEIGWTHQTFHQDRFGCPASREKRALQKNVIVTRLVCISPDKSGEYLVAIVPHHDVPQIPSSNAGNTQRRQN